MKPTPRRRAVTRAQLAEMEVWIVYLTEVLLPKLAAEGDRCGEEEARALLETLRRSHGMLRLWEAALPHEGETAPADDASLPAEPGAVASAPTSDRKH